MIFSDKYRLLIVALLTANLALYAANYDSNIANSSSINYYASSLINTLKPSSSDLHFCSKEVDNKVYIKRLQKKVFEPLAKRFGVRPHHFEFNQTLALEIFLEHALYKHAHKNDANKKNLITYLKEDAKGKKVLETLRKMLSASHQTLQKRYSSFQEGKHLAPMYLSSGMLLWHKNKSDNCIGFFE